MLNDYPCWFMLVSAGLVLLDQHSCVAQKNKNEKAHIGTPASKTQLVFNRGSSNNNYFSDLYFVVQLYLLALVVVGDSSKVPLDSNHVVTKSVEDETPGRWGWGYVQLISVQRDSKSIFLCFVISRPWQCVSWTKRSFWAKLSVSSFNPPCVGMVRSACSIHLSPRDPPRPLLSFSPPPPPHPLLLSSPLHIFL